jgi:hypothetical protein
MNALHYYINHLIRPIITYSSPFVRNQQKKDYRTKCLGFHSLNAPWFTRNTQKNGETNTPTIKDFITTLILNFHSRLPLATGAFFYNIGQTSLNSPMFKTMTITRRSKLKTNTDLQIPSITEIMN